MKSCDRDLIRQLLGYTPTILHGAEADSLALVRITAVIGDKWQTIIVSCSQKLNRCGVLENCDGAYVCH